jgi:large subunit ribosomal protein L15
MPLQRRLPKRGFKSLSPATYQVVNVGELSRCGGDQSITPQILAERGLVRKASLPVKILGAGILTQALEVQAQAFSLTATEKIRQAGGKAIILS